MCKKGVLVVEKDIAKELGGDRTIDELTASRTTTTEIARHRLFLQCDRKTLSDMYMGIRCWFRGRYLFVGD